MKNLIVSLIAGIAVLALTGTAAADEAGNSPDSAAYSLDAKEKCLELLCGPQAKAPAKKAVKRSGPSAIEKLRGRIDKLQSDIDQLRQDGANTKPIEDAIAALRAEMNARLAEAGKTGNDRAARIAAIEARLAEIAARLEQVEDEDPGIGVKVGPEAGFAYLNADGSNYTGVPVGARLTLTLGPTVDLALSADILIANSERPLGSRVRASVELLDKSGPEGDLGGGIAFGASALWVEYDRDLHASAAYIMGDITPTLRYRALRFDLSLMAGVQTTADEGPTVALGLLPMVGVDLP